MPTVPLYAIAHARSGDKGDGSNVGILAYDERGFEILRRELTEERVREHFTGIVRGGVDRYELPNLRALNFYIRGILTTGAASNHRIDKQAKSLGEYLRAKHIDVPEVLTAGL